MNVSHVPKCIHYDLHMFDNILKGELVIESREIKIIWTQTQERNPSGIFNANNQFNKIYRGGRI